LDEIATRKEAVLLSFNQRKVPKILIEGGKRGLEKRKRGGQEEGKAHGAPQC